MSTHTHSRPARGLKFLEFEKWLHPIRSFRLLYKVAATSVYRALHPEALRDVRRGQVEQCWCGGQLSTFEWHPRYGVCGRCGSYVNREPPLAEELRRIYSFEYYWHRRQRRRGNPSIEERPANDRADGRVEYWMDLIRRYGPPAGRVVEVGCGSGVLLAELMRNGFQCIGVDVDEKSARWVRERMKVDVRAGVFPEVDLPSCDLLLALDVIEHVVRPDAFLRRAAELLVEGGIAILQAPINRHDYEPPFGRRFEDAFDDLEHLFVFTDDAMRALGKDAGLEVVTLDEQLWLMGEVAIFRK